MHTVLATIKCRNIGFISFFFSFSDYYFFMSPSVSNCCLMFCTIFKQLKNISIRTCRLYLLLKVASEIKLDFFQS